MPPTLDENSPLEKQLPPEVAASPSELPTKDDSNLVWWKPGWKEMAGELKARWYYFLPAILVLLLLGFVFYILPGPDFVLSLVGIKLLILAGGLAVLCIGLVVRKVTRARKEPFCIHCGYNLTGLPDHYRCPECGRPYSWRVIDEYRRDPEWFIQRCRATQKLPKRDQPFTAGTQPSAKTRDDGTG